MRNRNKKIKNFISVILLLAASMLIVTTAWAALSLIDTNHERTQITDTGTSRIDVMDEAAQKSRARAPEPSTMVLLGGGLFGMFISFVRKTYYLTKRVLDVLIALIAFVVLSPLFLLAFLLIKCSSKGPVIFKQIRSGKNGKPFTIYKFRTMHVDAEKESGAVWAQKDDPRLIPMGKFLRKSHMDEIPQFFNVLKGDMSFIGPRPERPVFVEKLKKDIVDYEKRMDVKPGITGLAQVWNRYDETLSDVRKKIKYDLLYIKKMCLWTDIRILLRTFRVVVTGEGAR